MLLDGGKTKLDFLLDYASKVRDKPSFSSPRQ